MKENAETQYLEIMKDILENGTEVMDRTGTGTKKLFGKTIIHDFANGFPLLTTKKMHLRSIVGELLWFLKGTEDAQFLIDNKITIWDEWFQDAPEGNGKKILPHTYGTKWRNFGGVDQIANVVESIRTNPNSRRHVVSTWDPPNIDKAALPWCHVMFQFNVRGGYLDIAVYQRSADWFLGVPYNLASYGILLEIMSDMTGHFPGKMIYNFGDCHIYKNHEDACRTQLSREIVEQEASIDLIVNYGRSGPLDSLHGFAFPNLENISKLEISDFTILDYNPHPVIKAPVSV